MAIPVKYPIITPIFSMNGLKMAIKNIPRVGPPSIPLIDRAA